MAKEKFEGQVAPIVDKDLNKDGIIDMKEELVAAQAAVAEGTTVDPIQGEAIVDALTPVPEASTELVDEALIPAGELIESNVIDPTTLGENLTETQEIQETQQPELIETQQEIVDNGSSKILDNAGSQVSATFPQVRTVRPSGSFVM